MRIAGWTVRTLNNSALVENFSIEARQECEAPARAKRSGACRAEEAALSREGCCPSCAAFRAPTSISWFVSRICSSFE